MTRSLGFLVLAILAFTTTAESHITPCGLSLGGWSGGAHVSSMAIDKDGNIAIAGRLQGTIDLGGGPLAGSVFVAKFDPGCRHLWSKRFDSAHFGLADVRLDSFGNVVVAGSTRGSVDFGGGPLTAAGDYDIVLAKFAPAGSHMWSKRFGDNQRQIVGQMALDLDGNVVFVGMFHGSLNFGLGPLSGQAYIAKLNSSGMPLRRA